MAGPRPLAPHLQAALNNATTANRAYRDAALTVHEKYRLLAEEELAGLLATSDRMVRAAVDLGVPKSRFRVKHEGLHTSNPYALDKVLGRTEHLARAEATVQEAIATEGGNQYRIDADGYLWITPPADELAAVIANQNANPNTRYDADTVMPTEARYELLPTGVLFPVDGTSIPGAPSYERSPVVMWVDRGTHKADALAWLKDHETAVAA